MKTRFFFNNNQNDKIKEALKNALKKWFLPNWVHKKVIVHYYGEFYEDTAIGILLTNVYSASQVENYQIIDQLLKRGVTLPPPRKNPENFKTKADYFEYLSSHHRDLFIILRTRPAVMSEIDESKQTVLHHVVKFCSKTNPYQAELILNLVLKTGGLKFSKQDKNGNTALHLAAALCPQSRLYSHLMDAAKNSLFDFSIENNSGETVKTREKKFSP